MSVSMIKINMASTHHLLAVILVRLRDTYQGLFIYLTPKSLQVPT